LFGIKVLKIYGKTAIDTLKKLNLMDKNLRIKIDEESIIIPVVSNDLTLDVSFPYEFITFDFETKNNIPKSLSEYLKGKIPDNLQKHLTKSFDTIGHIAVIDLKEELVNYEELIAEGLLKRNTNIKSIYKKSKAVSGPYRIRGLEFIAGEDNSITTYQEYGIKMVVDIRKVYLSPRLSTEHNRVTAQILEGELILDMFTASGIFPLHFAKSVNCKVVAIDLNCNGIEFLKHNIQKNKLKGKIEAFCVDALEFDYSDHFDRIVMNHPSEAYKFLSKANELLKPRGIIYLYSFVDSENTEKACNLLINTYLPNYKITNILKVRQYSSTENHVCIELIKLE
jgi:tRNA (guanine37-N1)-methyltransferase